MPAQLCHVHLIVEAMCDTEPSPVHRHQLFNPAANSAALDTAPISPARTFWRAAYDGVGCSGKLGRARECPKGVKNSEAESHSRRVRSTPINGHRQTGPTGPFCANKSDIDLIMI